MMKAEDVIAIDGGPRVPKMYRLAVEYLSETEAVPMSRIYQDALDALLASRTWALKDLQDYYGRRADDLNTAMSAMKQRGVAAANTDAEAAKRARQAA
jgi:hypothetical protein